MIESPVIKEIYDNARLLTWRKAIEEALLVRMGKLSDDARARLQGLVDEDKVCGLFRYAMVCPTLDAFVDRLNQETTPKPPTSSRRKRKSGGNA